MRHGLIVEPFADGDYSFCIGYGEWKLLQDSLNMGPFELYAAMLNRQWRVEHLREIIRIGLIGGGIDVNKALNLSKNYVEGRPIVEHLGLALKILSASLSVPKGEEVELGEGEAVKKKGVLKSTSPPSTETRQ